MSKDKIDKLRDQLENIKSLKRPTNNDGNDGDPSNKKQNTSDNNEENMIKIFKKFVDSTRIEIADVPTKSSMKALTKKWKDEGKLEIKFIDNVDYLGMITMDEIIPKDSVDLIEFTNKIKKINDTGNWENQRLVIFINKKLEKEDAKYRKEVLRHEIGHLIWLGHPDKFYVWTNTQKLPKEWRANDPYDSSKRIGVTMFEKLLNMINDI